MSLAFEEFRILVAKVQHLDDLMGPDSSELAVDAVLLHLESHPELRDVVLEYLLRMLRDLEPGTREVAEYIAHGLRWEEFKIKLQDWLSAESSERQRHVLRRVLDAFAADWPSAKLYRRFGGALD